MHFNMSLTLNLPKEYPTPVPTRLDTVGDREDTGHTSSPLTYVHQKDSPNKSQTQISKLLLIMYVSLLYHQNIWLHLFHIPVDLETFQ